MAYGVIIRASAATAEGTHTIEILRDGYSGAVHEVHAGAPFYVEEYGQRGADIDADIRPSQVTASLVITDAAALSAVRGTLSAESREYRMVVRHGAAVMWQGYVMPVTSVTQLDDGTQAVRVVAKDRVRSLDDQAFAGAGGAPYTGQAALGTILERELGHVGHSITQHEYAARFRPAGVSDPYAQVRIDQARFYDDETGEPTHSRGDVVRAILGTQQAQLTQWRGRWEVTTPHAAGDTYAVDRWVARSDELSGEPAARQGRASYDVGGTAVALQNGSFEAGPIGGSPTAPGWTGMARRQVPLSAVEGQYVGVRDTVITEGPITPEQARSMASSYGYQRVPIVVGTGAFTVQVSAGGRIIQSGSGPGIRTDRHTLYLFAHIRHTGGYYYNDEAGQWQSGAHKIYLGSTFTSGLDAFWIGETIEVPTVPEGGEVEIALYSGVLATGDGWQSGWTAETWYDAVELTPASATGREVISFTSYSPTVQDGETEAIELPIGDGPFESARGAMRLASGALTSEWRAGSESRTVPHTQILAEHLMRTRGKGRRRVRLTTTGPVSEMAPVKKMQLDSISYWPVYMSIEWPRGQATIEGIELIDVPVPSGMRETVEVRPAGPSAQAGAHRVYDYVQDQGYVTPEAGDARYLRQTGGTLTGDLVFAGGGRISAAGQDALEVLSEDGTNHGELTVRVLRVLDHIDAIQTDILEVEDSYIKVNRGQTGTPSLNGGLIAERGSTDAYLEWDEGRDRWGWRMGADLNDGTFRAFVDESRSISTSNGIAGGGDLSANRQLHLTGQALNLHLATGTGVFKRTSGGVIGVNLVVNADIETNTITNNRLVNPHITLNAGAGIAAIGQVDLGGSSTIRLTGQALALHELSSNGLIARTGSGAVASRTIQGTTNQVNVSNGNGVSGNPTLSLPQDIHTGATPEFAGGTYTGDVAGQRGWIDRRIPWVATNADAYLLIGPIDTSSPGSNLSGVFTGARDTSSGGAGVVQIRVAYRRISGSTSYRVSADILDSTILGDDVRLYDVTHGGERWVALSFTGITSHVSPDSMTFSGLAENVEIKSVLGSEVTNAQPILGDGKYTLNAPMAQFLGQGRFTDFLTLDKQATSGSHALRADRTLRIQGTAKRITVSNDAALNLTSNRTWQITAPQDLHTDADFLVKTLRTKDWAGSTSFASGWTGHGWRAEDDHLEVTDLTVRNRLRVYELLIEQIRANNGSVAISNAAEVASVSGSTITLDEGVPVPFVVGDILRAQRFTGQGVYVSMIRVTSVGSGSFGFTLLEGDAPAEGMEYVRIGNISDLDRQGLVYLTASDSGAPYIDIIDGIDDHTKWNSSDVVRSRFGRLDGLTVPGFGQLDGYGGYIQRGYIDKEVIIGGAGLNIDSFQQRPSALWHFDGSLVDTISGATPDGYEDATITDYGLVTGDGLVATLRQDGRFGGGVAVEEGTENLMVNPRFDGDLGGSSPSGWSLGTHGTDFDIAQIVSSPFGTPGVQAYHVRVANARAYLQQTGANAPASEGDIFAVSWYATSGDVQLWTDALNADGSINSNLVSSGGGEHVGGGRYIYVSPPMPPGTAHFRLRRIGIGTAGSVTGEAIFERVQVERKPYATSFTEGTRAEGAMQVPIPQAARDRGSLAFMIRYGSDPDDYTHDSLWMHTASGSNVYGSSRSLNFRQNTLAGRVLGLHWGTEAGVAKHITGTKGGTAYREGEDNLFVITWDRNEGYDVWINGERVAFEATTADDPLRSFEADYLYVHLADLLSQVAWFPYRLSAAEIRRIALSDAPIQERPSQVRITGEQILVGTDTLIRDGFIQTKYIDTETLFAQQAFVGDWDIVSGNITSAGVTLNSSGYISLANNAGISGTGSGNDAVRMWAGGTYANRASAAFNVRHDGTLNATKANITGEVNADSGRIGTSVIIGEYSDSLSSLSTNHAYLGHSLTFGGTVTQPGLIIKGSQNDRYAQLGIKVYGTAPAEGIRPTLRVQHDSDNLFAVNERDDRLLRITKDGNDVLMVDDDGLKVTGEINATSGTFTGYVTAGNLRLGTDVSGSNNGIWINSTNYWYDTGNFGIGAGPSRITFFTQSGLSITNTHIGLSESSLRLGKEDERHITFANGANINFMDGTTSLASISGTTFRIGQTSTGNLNLRITNDLIGFRSGVSPLDLLSITPTNVTIGEPRLDGSTTYLQLTTTSLNVRRGSQTLASFGTTINIQNALRVDASGNGTFEGDIYATGGTFTGVVNATEIHTDSGTVGGMALSPSGFFGDLLTIDQERGMVRVSGDFALGDFSPTSSGSRLTWSAGNYTALSHSVETNTSTPATYTSGWQTWDNSNLADKQLKITYSAGSIGMESYAVIDVQMRSGSTILSQDELGASGGGTTTIPIPTGTTNVRFRTRLRAEATIDDDRVPPRVIPGSAAVTVTQIVADSNQPFVGPRGALWRHPVTYNPITTINGQAGRIYARQGHYWTDNGWGGISTVGDELGQDVYTIRIDEDNGTLVVLRYTASGATQRRFVQMQGSGWTTV